MGDTCEDVTRFLSEHPFFHLTDSNKVKCTLNGHEFPPNLTELHKFTSGRKYQTLSAVAEFNYAQFEPHVVPSTKQPNRLFCKLTLRHINRLPPDVLRHVNGKRFKRALQKYKECQEKGVEFVPACLQRRKPKKREEEEEEEFGAKGSNDDGGDSDDSCSDLYPASMFALKTQEVMELKESNGFETDSDEADTPMDVVEQEGPPKRKKQMQSLGGRKKFKSGNRRKNGPSKAGKIK